MRIRSNTTKVLFLSIFATILCIYPLYVSAQGSKIAYLEKNDYNGRPPRVLTTRMFVDGTVVARIVKDVPGTPTCIYDKLSLRFINTDGTVVEKDFTLEKLKIPQTNYCKLEGELDYQLIRNNQILVTYYTPNDDVNTFEQWGIIIDLDGNELNRISFGSTVGPHSKITLNTDRQKGFLRLSSIVNTDGVINTMWIQYKIEENGAFTQLTDGSLNFDFFASSTATVMSTVGESYAVAYATMGNNFVATNPLLSQGTLHALTIGYNQTTVSPLLLYQTPIPNLSFRALYCDISFAGVGQVCTLTVSTVDATGLVTNNFYIKVNFLSSGSVTSSKVISRRLPLPTDNLNLIWKVDSLPFGGYLFTNVTNSVQNTIFGYLFGEEDTDPVGWGLPYPEPINSNGVFQILPNNSLYIFQEGADNSWQIEMVDLPRFDPAKVDTGYSNINVESTIPGIGVTINEDEIKNVQITFYNPVELSEGKLKIYQMGDKPSLRQMIPGLRCELSEDGKTVNAGVLISTFSVPKGNYFIMMENNFVKDKAYKEPLLGIRDNVWWFTTDEEQVELTPSRSALFRLSVEGTKVYDDLSRTGRRDFFNKLREELAVAVPVDPSRFVIIEKSQLDRTVNEKQYLMSISVKDNKDKNDISVKTIIDYIHTMVSNKDQTQIHLGEVTKYLDETFGFNLMQNIWEKYRTVLIVLFCVIMLLFASFFSAQFKTRSSETKVEIRNVAILQLGLIIFDLVVDILFVSNSSKDFPELYIPSVVFVTLPIAINTTLAFYIITQENSLNQRFYQWFIKNGKIASVFTVLAGADIEALNILHSNLLGVELFGAPFSERAKEIITYGGYANIFTEDIPQVIIQIIYYRRAVSYGLIPLLTFISSVLTLAINLATTIYDEITKDRSAKPTENNNSQQTQQIQS